LGWAVEASFAGEARREGAHAGALVCGGGSGCAAAAENGEEGFIWEWFSTRLGGGAEALEAHPASGGPMRSTAGMSATRRRAVGMVGVLTTWWRA
jgi:hypothetical protein